MRRDELVRCDDAMYEWRWVTSARPRNGNSGAVEVAAGGGGVAAGGVGIVADGGGNDGCTTLGVVDTGGADAAVAGYSPPK